jgi:3-methyladenine DNA glycosylase AlkD
MLEKLQKDLQSLADPIKAKFLQGFFKTGEGQYSAGDVFLGIKVPETRKIVAKYFKSLSLDDLKILLKSNFHEYRLAAWLVLVKKYEAAANKAAKKELVDFYLANLTRANNWDLVDLSAPRILGDFLLHAPLSERAILRRLAKSDNLWEQRVAIVATYTLIKGGELQDTLDISLLLLSHPHDLIHKAVGWMLRELGKKDQILLEKFLCQNYAQCPRTTLRYAIERFENEKGLQFLRGQFS